MPTVAVRLADRSYDVIVENGILARLGENLIDLGRKPGRIAVVTDSNVGAIHAPAALDSLEACGFKPSVHTIPAGEGSKSMAVAESVCREMIRAGHDRSSLVVALGGGVVGDLAGFVAAIFFRGVPVVQIPTTIVSQVDSSVGGKTGVNAPEGKNLIGAFHQPLRVLVDPETLATLPGREFREGFAEVIKHAAIRDAEMLEDIARLDPGNQRVPHDLIARNIAIKARIVEEDEKETSGTRALLNFGHTIGHGIEAAVPYGSLLHGEAISLGMRAALFLSERHAGLPASDSKRILDLLAQFQLPLILPREIATPVVLEKLATDKKFTVGAIKFVVIATAGDATLTNRVTRDDLREAVEHLRTPVTHPAG